MFKKITKYQTADGREYATAEYAAQHVEALICDALSRELHAAKLSTLTHADVTKLTLHLYANRAAIRAALDLELFGEDETE